MGDRLNYYADFLRQLEDAERCGKAENASKWAKKIFWSSLKFIWGSSGVNFSTNQQNFVIFATQGDAGKQ